MYIYIYIYMYIYIYIEYQHVSMWFYAWKERAQLEAIRLATEAEAGRWKLRERAPNMGLSEN